MLPWFENTGTSTWAVEWLASLIDVTIRTTVLLAITLLGARLLRHSGARVRGALWSSALLGILFMPIVYHLSPAWHLNLWPRSIQAKPNVVAGPTHCEAATSAKASLAETEPRIPWAELTVSVWLTGATFLLGRLAIGSLRAHRLTRTAAPLPSSAWWPATARVIKEAAGSREVRLLQHDHVSIPFTWGALRPVILLPRSAESWSLRLRYLVLQHELAHIRRNDWIIQALAQTAGAIYWFNPLTWVALRHLRMEREHACDEYVLDLGVKRSEYAALLLEAVRPVDFGVSQPAGTLAVMHTDGLEARILAILRSSGPARRSMALVPTVVASLSVLAVSLATMRLTPEEPTIELPTGHLGTAMSPPLHWDRASNTVVPDGAGLRATVHTPQLLAAHPQASGRCRATQDSPATNAISTALQDEVPIVRQLAFWARTLSADDDEDEDDDWPLRPKR